MEYQMDAMYTLLNVKHLEVLTAMRTKELPKWIGVNIAAHLSNALDAIQACSEDFAYLDGETNPKTGQEIVPVTDGPTGESFNPLQD